MVKHILTDKVNSLFACQGSAVNARLRPFAATGGATSPARPRSIAHRFYGEIVLPMKGIGAPALR